MYKKIMFTMFFWGLLNTMAFAAPVLVWDAVTMGNDGLLLSADNQVLSYNVYKCPALPCTKANATFFGAVGAPNTSADVVGQPIPQTYFVTAVNPNGESGESATITVGPVPAVPQNLHIQ